MFTLIHDPIPSKVALYPAYPNPFNPVTTLRFDIPNSDISQKVLLLIFDINGRQVESLVNGSKLPGAYQIQWHADQFASGMYFAKLISGGIVKNAKDHTIKVGSFASLLQTRNNYYIWYQMKNLLTTNQLREKYDPESILKDIDKTFEANFEKLISSLTHKDCPLNKYDQDIDILFRLRAK